MLRLKELYTIKYPKNFKVSQFACWDMINLIIGSIWLGRWKSERRKWWKIEMIKNILISLLCVLLGMKKLRIKKMSLYKFIHMLLLKRYSIKTKNWQTTTKKRQSPKFFFFF